MKHISLKGSWVIKAPIDQVFNIMTDFEKWPLYFPKVAESLKVIKREGNYLEMDAAVKSFGQKFPVKMKYQIIPGRGYISDNESPKFGTSGHEELLMEETEEGTRINYIYEVDIHNKWLRVIAKPLIGWFSMKFWQKAVIDELRKRFER